MAKDLKTKIDEALKEPRGEQSLIPEKVEEPIVEPIVEPKAKPVEEKIDGIGTLTRIPKEQELTGTEVGVEEEEMVEGMLERQGIKTPSGAIVDKDTGELIKEPPKSIPTFGTTGKVEESDAIKALRANAAAIDKLEADLLKSTIRTPKEEELLRNIQSAKAELKRFDVGTEKATEAFIGTGRGRTQAFVATQQAKERRVRALERIGLATEANILIDELALEEGARKDISEQLRLRLELSGKKVDAALGIQSEIERVEENERGKAREFILDIVDFSEGSLFDELDSDTQQQIMDAVANSPITLDMVKKALQTAADKQDEGDLRTVPGVGVVRVKGDTFTVIVPEEDGIDDDTDVSDAPTFEEFIKQKENEAQQSFSQERRDDLRAEYDSIYGGEQAVVLSKLTAGNKRDIAQAGLRGTSTAAQGFFLNTPSEFRDLWQREFALGQTSENPTLEEVEKRYTVWFNEKQAGKSGGSTDFSKLFPEG